MFLDAISTVAGTERRLGYWEAFNAAVHDEAYGHGTIATLTKINAQQNLADFFQIGMHALFQKHPMLRCTLTKGDDGFYVAHMNANFDHIPIRVIDAANEEAVLAIYEQELKEPFQANTSLWRATLIVMRDQPYFYLITASSHALIDGLAAFQMVKDFIQYANELGTGHFAEPESLPFLKPVEQMLDKSRFEEESSVILGRGATKQVAEEEVRTTWPFQAQDPSLTERSTGSVLLELLPEMVTPLHKACKERGLTINDALNTALLIALLKIQNEAGKPRLCTSLCTPIDLRGFCSPKIPREHLGCNVTMVMTEHLLAEGAQDFWAIATDYHTKVRASIASAGQYPEAYTMDMIAPYVEQCKAQRDQFFMPFGISNLGRIDFETLDGAPFSPELFYFAASRQAGDFAGLVCPVTLNNHVFINFSFTKPMCQPEWVKQLAEKFREELSLVLAPRAAARASGSGGV